MFIIIIIIDVYSFAHSMQTVLKKLVCFLRSFMACLHCSLNRGTFGGLSEETYVLGIDSLAVLMRRLVHLLAGPLTLFSCFNEKTCTFTGRTFDRQNGLLPET